MTPAPNTPAAEAGLLPGDRVVAIDRVSTDGMDLGDAAMRLRGSEGSTVQLTIQRNNSTLHVVLTRREVRPVPAVQARLETTWEGKLDISVCISSHSRNCGILRRNANRYISRANGHN